MRLHREMMCEVAFKKWTVREVHYDFNCTLLLLCGDCRHGNMGPFMHSSIVWSCCSECTQTCNHSRCGKIVWVTAGGWNSLSEMAYSITSQQAVLSSHITHPQRCLCICLLGQSWAVTHTHNPHESWCHPANVSCKNSISDCASTQFGLCGYVCKINDDSGVPLIHFWFALNHMSSSWLRCVCQKHQNVAEERLFHWNTLLVSGT